MPRIKINGREVEAQEGARLLEVCLENGFHVPHYCWHPGLSPAGNCRMCLVKVSNSRKLEASCMYPCTEGLEVWTEGPEIDAARKAVLEYMLINHPLDCPICDKAGECLLQDYTYKYRGGLSRFEEPKNIRHTKDLGPNIRIWGNRCIVCTRCVRFCEEVAGAGELAVVRRGDRSVIDVFPGIPLDNPLSLNVVDLCPVGALNDKNFLYQARVWFATKIDTICPYCSRGCNAHLTVLANSVKRMTPRPNPDVNRWWLCDEGRLSVRHLSGDGRLRTARGSAADVAAAARKFKMAGVVSSWQTMEELYLFKKLMEAVGGGPVGFLTSFRGERRVFKGGFAIEPDKTPNRAGAAVLFGPEAVERGIQGVVDALRAGTAQALLVINGIPAFEMPADLLEAARKASFVAVCDVMRNPLEEFAQVVMPGTAWAEKEGTFMNCDGRVQRIRAALRPPVGTRTELEWLREMVAAAGAAVEASSAEAVFRQAAPGLDYARVGKTGVKWDG